MKWITIENTIMTAIYENPDVVLSLVVVWAYLMMLGCMLIVDSRKGS